jgi:hypothetical protein
VEQLLLLAAFLDPQNSQLQSMKKTKLLVVNFVAGRVVST